MKHICRISALVLVCIMVLSSVPTVSTAEEISETYAYGDILSSDEYIESLEEFDPNDYATGNARSSVLPVSFDISTNESTAPYFPAIGNQGSVGACTSFASVYYQFTYEANKLTNTVTTPENTFCPFYIYGIVGVGRNEGSYLERNYTAISKLGCIKYSDVSDNDFLYPDLTPYDGMLTDDDYLFLRDIMTGSASPISNVRAYLSDINGDGNINSRDSMALRALINNN